QGQYAPGSTFKLVTSIAALKAGVITPRSTIVDKGVFTIGRCHGGGCSFHNAGGAHYGPLSITRAITVSSDVFFYTLGYDFWIGRSRFGDGIQATARDLGLGSATGIPLSPEAPGRIPDPESRKRLHEQLPKAYP